MPASDSARRYAGLAARYGKLAGVLGYAVVDLETTGLSPSRQHKIVELAVVHVSPEGEITGQWETLVNPLRDLGPQRIHRVTAAQTAHAPTFDLVADELAELLAGRVVVAHNLRFDGGFLAAEYGRHGYRVPLGPHFGLCTMELASRYLPKVGRSLAACCQALGITIGDAHRASADALATARLLAGYLRMDPGGPRWADELAVAAEHPWPTFTLPRGEWVARELATSQGHFLTRLPDTHSAVKGEVGYLALLDQALLDRHISVAEADALVALAKELGIGRAAALDLHRAYLRQLAGGVSDLHVVAGLLGLGDHEVDEALAAGRTAPVVRRFSLAAGDKVVFTGEMRRERPEWERAAIDAGLSVHPAITKKVKLLVAADPDTLSGKGRKARHYGIPVITEDAFEGLLDRGLHRDRERDEGDHLLEVRQSRGA